LNFPKKGAEKAACDKRKDCGLKEEKTILDNKERKEGLPSLSKGDVESTKCEKERRGRRSKGSERGKGGGGNLEGGS